MKLGPSVLDEAEGLRELRAVDGGPAVPEVVLAEPGLLVTEWVAQAAQTDLHEDTLGRALAALHTASWREWGGGSRWIGLCQVDAGVSATGAEFYARRLSDLAARCGLSAQVQPVIDRLDDLLPATGPSLLHGDLWWGNVLWGAGGRPWLIDPSVHGGHPEEDLAMLGLFGPVPERLIGAYQEVRPLDNGWQDRVALFQLYPLLVHTVLFGGSYRSRATEAARRYQRAAGKSR